MENCQETINDDSEMKPTTSTNMDSADNSSPSTSENVKPSTKEESQSNSNMNQYQQEDDEGRLCPICLESWTNAGDHRVCCLKCGHVFGYCCIERWFSTQKNKSCPSCKERSSNKHIWFIYAKNLAPMKGDHLEEARKDILCAIEERDKVEVELQKALSREETLKKEVLELAQKTQFLHRKVQLKQQFCQPTLGISSNSSCKLCLDKSLQLSDEPGCRVLDYFSKGHIIVASVKSSNSLFPGFGARQLDLSASKPTTYIPLHSKSIRDMKFNTDNPSLLSVSLDKTAKIVNTSPLSAPVVIYNSESPLWSCCWDSNNSNYVYIGQQEGSIVKIDIRQSNKPITVLEVPGDRSPVLSIVSIPANSNRSMPGGGVISCKLNSLWAFENTNEEYVRHRLSLEGPFISMAYQHFTKDFLVSSRPNSKYSYSRHYLWQLDNTTGSLSCNVTQTIKGSTVQSYLSRSCFITRNFNSYIAAHNESDQCLCLWDVKTGNKACSTAARDPILDICGVSFNNNNFIVSLTEKKIAFHKLF
ncbi:hypothetical protein RI129_009136 [Pyrocoelia pectoralis]|uniref:RING-type E3 ubiquitin transferase n=1 Tax=Pyrocoelia pectoralis TaxID=417401 RepID=A0AAN7VB64_9COLE